MRAAVRVPGAARFPASPRALLLVLGSALALAFPARAAEGAPLLFLGNKNIAPVVYLDGEAPAGVAVDLVRELAAHLPRPVEIRAMDWSTAQGLVLRGEADALIQMNPSEERRKLYDFSEPLLESQFSIFTRADVTGLSGAASLRGLQVGVEAGGLPQQVLSRDPAVKLVVIPDFLRGFAMLSARELDAVVVDYRVGAYFVARNGIRGVRVAGHPVAYSSASIAVRKGNAQLLEAIDAALRAMRKDGSYQRVLERWKPKEVVFWTREQLTWALTLASFAGLLALLLLGAAWMATLRRELVRRKAAEEKLSRHNAVLGGIINGADAIIWSTDRDYRYTSFNARHAEVMRVLYGAEIELDRSLPGYMTIAGDRETVRRNLDRALAGEHVVEEAWAGGDGGARRYYRVAHSPIASGAGEVIGVAALAQDLTDRKQAEETIRRVNRELHAFTRCTQTLMRAADEPSLLRDVCRIICEEAGYRMAWVGYPADDEGKTVTPMAWAGLEEGYLAAAAISWADTARGHGAVGVAIRSGESACLQDFATEPAGAPWREAALERGYRSSAAFPLKDESARTFGVLSIYSAERGAFTRDELRLLEELAGDLAFGITVLRARVERERAERELERLFSEARSERERAEARAAELDAILSSMADGVLLYSTEGEILRANRAAEHVLRRTQAAASPSAGAARWALDAVREDGTPLGSGDELLVRRALQGEVVEGVMLGVAEAGSGKRAWLATSAAPIRDAQGRVRGAVLTFHDMTERKNVTALLARREEEYRTLVENIPDHLARFDPDGRIAYSGPSVSGFIGMFPDGFLGRTLLDPAMPGAPAPREELHQAIRRAAALGEASIHELEPPLAGGEAMFEFRVVPERDTKGKVARVLVLARDVSERRRLERQMRDLNQELERRVAQRTAQYEAANRELEAFAYSVSHDLRAPLRHVDGFLELLGRQVEGALDERSRSYLAAVSGAARRMGELIDDLLSFARMGRAELSRSRVELGPLVEEVKGELAPELENREVCWRIGPLPVVSGDRAMLRAALSNLVANAVKFTRPRHPALIEVGALLEVPGETVLFVRDNGVGFDPAYGHKLFGVFQRLHRNDEFEGTGIGLANVRRIVARHGGRTWAEGAVGEGATFFIALPEAPPELLSEPPVRATAGAAAGRSR